jgi:murein DD-endopeptidase MepM/ murein hydrolase activator NlpD
MQWLILAAIILGLGGFWAADKPREVLSPAATTTPQEIREEISVSVIPDKIEQGDPALIVVNGTTTIKSLKFNGKTLKTFVHDGKTSALIGFDLRGSFGTFPIELELSDGTEVERKFAVEKRFIATAPLGIPEKLGGDTPEAEKTLINTLVEEGRLISAIPTSPEKLWEGEFALPLKGEIVITDTYGYSRQTGGSSISHKGTDFRAKVGTPVYAMNSGVVRFTRNLRNYGNTVILDHGLGLHTVYMHLSKIEVKEGERVEKGDLIAYSGDTGYVLGPHLHLTVRINGISIDPEKFMKLF